MTSTRTFVALPLPTEVTATIRDLRLGLPPPPRGLRWSQLEAAHLTLVFLGDLEDAELRGVAERTREVAAATRGFDADLRGIGAFPRPERARIAWVGGGQGADAIAGLRSALTRALGGPADGRPFAPHVTIARARMPLDLRTWLAAAPPYRSPAWRITAMEVMASELARDGAVHTVVARCPLAPCGPPSTGADGG
jgi:RNA 2',3'-cyclic 3'-phosphodiesterase